MARNTRTATKASPTDTRSTCQANRPARRTRWHVPRRAMALAHDDAGQAVLALHPHDEIRERLHIQQQHARSMRNLDAPVFFSRAVVWRRHQREIHRAIAVRPYPEAGRRNRPPSSRRRTSRSAIKVSFELASSVAQIAPLGCGVIVRRDEDELPRLALLDADEEARIALAIDQRIRTQPQRPAEHRHGPRILVARHPVDRS
jgi:hypothetical protein